MSESTAGPSVLDVDAAVWAVLTERFRAVGGRRGGLALPPAEDVFAGRLLSLRQAQSLPSGTREVRVAPGTVVTPLARDFLKRLGVGIKYAARSEVDRAGNVGEWGFAIEAKSGILDAFRRSLLDGADVWHDLGGSSDDAVLWVAEAESRGALVLTDEASAVVYRACQRAGVRAASAEDPGATARAVRAVGVNLLAVEPSGKPIALLRQIGATFRRMGAPVAPDWVGTSRGGRAS
ncbi:MAG: hypothetical protein LC745_02455 [Planctomycetia bacterium]|nr:hypothetical protein [Planctomycetia bacterium]